MGSLEDDADLGGVGGVTGSLPNPWPAAPDFFFLAKRDVSMALCMLWGVTKACVVAERKQAIAKSFIVDRFMLFLNSKEEEVLSDVKMKIVVCDDYKSIVEYDVRASL
mmetsp:Transcript_41161/g.99173  ORF Transcript_41161/g.99173 Transcript_41161/m.99173 type:complete len:108 (-) Transcript_41161:287-610(-)